MPQHDKDSSGNSSVNVGVIILCRNNADTVLNAIHSVIKQDYPYIYMVIINDGSTDKSEATIRQILTDVKTDTLDEDGESFTVGMIGLTPTILIGHAKVDGDAISKNKGILALWQSVQYYTILEAHNTFFPSKVSKCVAVAEADKNVGLVYHSLIAFTDDISYTDFAPPYDRDILEISPLVPVGALISRSAFEAVGSFEHTLTKYDNWDLWLRVTERYMAIHLTDVLGNYVVDKSPIDQTAAQIVIERTQIRKG